MQGAFSEYRPEGYAPKKSTHASLSVWPCLTRRQTGQGVAFVTSWGFLSSAQGVVSRRGQRAAFGHSCATEHLPGGARDTQDHLIPHPHIADGETEVQKENQAVIGYS